jgi:hypothetical protein
VAEVAMTMQQAFLEGKGRNTDVSYSEHDSAHLKAVLKVTKTRTGV